MIKPVLCATPRVTLIPCAVSSAHHVVAARQEIALRSVALCRQPRPAPNASIAVAVCLATPNARCCVQT